MLNSAMCCIFSGTLRVEFRVVGSWWTSSLRWVFYSLRKCTFMYLIDLQMIYDFITEPTICWQYVLNVLSSFNYEVSMMFMRNGCLTGKCDLNWFEEFDYLLLLRFKLCKCWLMNWGVKLFMDLHWKHELKACSWN
jgi:hypothetical protein